MRHLLLLPISWLYGAATDMRNWLFDIGVLKSKSYDIPIISVGNITVGGTGKTPHVEYLIHLLADSVKVAVLSRGYKRKTKGYRLATTESTARQIGDEPLQMKRKFPAIYVAVDANRREGIERITRDDATKDTDVILLDDAYQHRYVKPGINILLVNYNRQLYDDHLLPYGRLRESRVEKKRADIVIITKCPATMKPMDIRLVTNHLGLYPYQTLLFSTMEYRALRPMYCGSDVPLQKVSPDTHVLLISGIANPQEMLNDLQPRFTNTITHITFADHHSFTKEDIKHINTTFDSLPEPRMAITTEKDSARLFGIEGLNEEFRHNAYMVPIEVKFLFDQEEIFNNKIISHVQKNSRNSILVKVKDDHKPDNSHHSGNRARTISFRNN